LLISLLTPPRDCLVTPLSFITARHHHRTKHCSRLITRRAKAVTMLFWRDIR
jgi:hypothetical protein